MAPTEGSRNSQPYTSSGWPCTQLVLHSDVRMIRRARHCENQPGTVRSLASMALMPSDGTSHAKVTLCFAGLVTSRQRSSSAPKRGSAKSASHSSTCHKRTVVSADAAHPHPAWLPPIRCLPMCFAIRNAAPSSALSAMETLPCAACETLPCVKCEAGISLNLHGCMDTR